VVLSVESAEFFNLNQERYINLKYECMRALKFCSLVAKIRLCQLLASLGCFTDEGRFCDVREFQYSKSCMRLILAACSMYTQPFDKKGQLPFHT
jgi:hypothetical protein